MKLVTLNIPTPCLLYRGSHYKVTRMTDRRIGKDWIISKTCSHLGSCEVLRGPQMTCPQLYQASPGILYATAIQGNAITPNVFWFLELV